MEYKQKMEVLNKQIQEYKSQEKKAEMLQKKLGY